LISNALSSTDEFPLQSQQRKVGKSEFKVSVQIRLKPRQLAGSDYYRPRLPEIIAERHLTFSDETIIIILISSRYILI
jgi:hypothetical protein